MFTGIGLDVPPLKRESGGMKTPATRNLELPWRRRAQKAVTHGSHQLTDDQREAIGKEISERRWRLSAVRLDRAQKAAYDVAVELENKKVAEFRSVSSESGRRYSVDWENLLPMKEQKPPA